MKSNLLIIPVTVILVLILAGSTTAYSAPSSFSSASFQLPGGTVNNSSPTLADLDGNGQREILVGTTGQPSVLVVVNPDGTIRWSKDVGAPINSSPAVGDINGDGFPEIVVSVGGDVGNPQHDGGVIAFDRFGNQLWTFLTQDILDPHPYRDGVFSSPTLCDLNGDGKMEIAFGAWDQRIYLLDSNGNSLWNNLPNGYPGPGYFNQDSSWSTAACADLNHSGQKQIIIGADISPGTLLDKTPIQAGGFIYVFDKNGNVLVRRYLPETVFSSPAVGDLNGDGNLEIVTGTGYYWYVNGHPSQPYVYAFDTSQVLNSGLSYSDPAKLPNLAGWPQATDLPGFSSPALADLNGDGKLDVVIGTGNPNTNPAQGKVYAWNGNGVAIPGWPVTPQNWQGTNTAILSSPTVADIDNDGSPEVLFSMLWDVQVYGANGAHKFDLYTQYSVWGSPAIGDTNGDGFIEVWIGSSNFNDSSHGYLWRFTSSTSGIGQTPWPMFHHDPQHTGRAPLSPTLSVTPSSIYVMHQLGDASSEKVTAAIRNVGDGSFDWHVTSTPGGVAVSPSSGTVTTLAQATITIPTAGQPLGTQNLGNVVITASPGTVIGSPATIPITLQIVKTLFRLYLPLIVR